MTSIKIGEREIKMPVKAFQQWLLDANGNRVTRIDDNSDVVRSIASALNDNELNRKSSDDWMDKHDEVLRKLKDANLEIEKLKAALKSLEDEAFRVADGHPEFIYLKRAVENARKTLEEIK